MRFTKYGIAVGALMAAAFATFWSGQTASAEVPKTIALSQNCFPEAGLVVTFWWQQTGEDEVKVQWLDVTAADGSGAHFGTAVAPTGTSYAWEGAHPGTTYAVTLSQQIGESSSWSTSPIFYFEAWSCGSSGYHGYGYDHGHSVALAGPYYVGVPFGPDAQLYPAWQGPPALAWNPYFNYHYPDLRVNYGADAVQPYWYYLDSYKYPYVHNYDWH